MRPLIEDPKKHTIYSDLTDRELFETMSKRETDPDASLLAWTEFHKRYATYLWNGCLLLCKNCIEGVDLAKDIFQSAMPKIYLNAHQFKGTSVKGWISKIAQNEFHDYVKKYHLNFSQELTPEIEELEGDLEEEDEELYNKIVGLKFEQLTKLLSKLSEREYKVLVTSMTYHQIDGASTHMPDDVIKSLCDEFNIERDNIRQIKKRALIKLKKLAKDI